MKSGSEVAVIAKEMGIVPPLSGRAVHNLITTAAFLDKNHASIVSTSPGKRFIEHLFSSGSFSRSEMSNPIYTAMTWRKGMMKAQEAGYISFERIGMSEYKIRLSSQFQDHLPILVEYSRMINLPDEEWREHINKSEKLSKAVSEYFSQRAKQSQKQRRISKLETSEEAQEGIHEEDHDISFPALRPVKTEVRVGDVIITITQIKEENE